MVDRYLGPPARKKKELSQAADTAMLGRGDAPFARRMAQRAQYADPGRRLDLDANKLTGRAGSVPLDQSMIEAIAMGSQARFPLARTEAEQELYGGVGTPDTAMGYSPRQQAAARLAGLQLSPGERDSASSGALTAPVNRTVGWLASAGVDNTMLDDSRFDEISGWQRPYGLGKTVDQGLGFDALNIDLDVIGKEAATAYKEWQDAQPKKDGPPPPTAEETCVAEGGTWNGTSCEFPGKPDKTPEEQCVAAGGTWNGTSCDLPDAPVFDPFGGAAADINSAFNITTQDLTDKIRKLVADGKVSANLLTADLIQQIKDSAERRKTQVKSIKDTSLASLEKQNVNRKAIQAEVSAAAQQRMQQMQADTNAQIAAGRLNLGTQLTSEFEQVATMVTGLTDSIAAGHEGSMARIEAVANIAAAQRLAAPALLMADAENALGDEKFRLINEAELSLTQTLNSLTEQENTLVLQEAQRIEAFNNDRDMAMASAMVSLGMAKLQNSIDTVQRAEDRAERLEIRLASEATQAAAAAESKRRWEADFQQTEDSLALAQDQWNRTFDFGKEKFDFTKEESKLDREVLKDAAKDAKLSSKQKADAAAAQNKLLSSMTAYTPDQVAAMTDTQRNTLFSNVQSNLDDIKRAASVRPGTFRWLVDDLDTDPAIAGMAIAVAEHMRNQDIAREVGDQAAMQAAQDAMDALLEPYWGLDSTMQKYETADMRAIKSLAGTALAALPRMDAEANYEDYGESIYGSYGISDSTRQVAAYIGSN